MPPTLYADMLPMTSPARRSGRGARPAPEVPEAEVREITQQMQEGQLKPKPKVLFEVGEAIKVIDGPFQDFNGTVEEVKPEKGKVRVLISIFGRAPPVELDFVQVEKACGFCTVYSRMNKFKGLILAEDVHGTMFGNYCDVIAAYRNTVADLNVEDQRRVFVTTAEQVYRV